MLRNAAIPKFAQALQIPATTYSLIEYLGRSMPALDISSLMAVDALADVVEVARRISRLPVSDTTQRWALRLAKQTMTEVGGLRLIETEPERVVAYLRNSLGDKHPTRLARYQAIYYIYRGADLPIPQEYRTAKSRAERLTRYARAAKKADKK